MYCIKWFIMQVFIYKKNSEKKIYILTYIWPTSFSFIAFWSGIKKIYYFSLKPPQGFWQHIKPQPTRWQYPLITYLSFHELFPSSFFIDPSSSISPIKKYRTSWYLENRSIKYSTIFVATKSYCLYFKKSHYSCLISSHTA